MNYEICTLRCRETRRQTTFVTVFYCFLTALVVIVSSCSDEEFTCKPGECISPALQCNFKTDCENGSDEEFCGICIYILGSIFTFEFPATSLF